MHIVDYLRDRAIILAKTLLPYPLVQAICQYRVKMKLKEYKGLTTEQIFIKIYEENAWGRSIKEPENYYSGSGSHDERIVRMYVASIRDFLGSFKIKPDVVDLGCGDFYIGQQIRYFCGNYIACDIVPSLIDHNKIKYVNQQVDFRVLDITQNQLPVAEIVFIRQVFQHLSNDQILKTIPKLTNGYKFIVLTEHLPIMKGFTPNLDKSPGPDVRLSNDSGVVLTEYPFNLRVKNERVLCEVTDSGALIRT